MLPLEEAAREIERLREDLARAKRMEKFYEERYEHQLGEHRHARAHEIPKEQHAELEPEEYTCVFPQPGADVSVLPPEWRARAHEILEKYNVTWAAEGIKVQGCCCGNEHKKLDEATSTQFCDAGFLIEHNAESLPHF